MHTLQAIWMLSGVIKTISCSLFFYSTKKKYSVLEIIQISGFLHPWLTLERAVAPGEDVLSLAARGSVY
jgi:hypothetical protein